MKRLVLFLTALIVLVASVAYVPVMASAATALPTYSLTDAVSTYRKYQDGSYWVTVGTLDERSSIIPRVVYRTFDNGSLLSQTNYDSFNVPVNSTLDYDDRSNFTANVYPLGVVNGQNAVVDISGAVSGNWTFTYSLAFWEDSLYNAPVGDFFDPATVRVQLFWYDSNYNFVSQTSEIILSDDFTGSVKALGGGNNMTASANIEVPSNAKYLRYGYYFGQYGQGIHTDSQFSGQLFCGGTVSFFTYDFIPHPNSTEDLLDDLVNGYVPPVIPDGAGDLDDVHDMEMGILGGLLDTVVQITQQTLASLEIIQRYGTVLGFIGWLFSLLYHIQWVQELIQISFMLGIVTVLLNVSLTVTSGIRAGRKSGTNNTKSKSSKGD